MRLVEWTKPSENGLINKATFTHPLAGMFQNVFNNDLFPGEHAAFVPAVNISEEADSYRIDLSAPGFDKSDFKILVEKRKLTVTGTHKQDLQQNFSRKEFAYGSFERSFRLPENANEQGVSAKYQNGILSLIVPKKEQEKNASREIVVE